MKRKMEQTKISDKRDRTSTMLAVNAYEKIINEIRSSNLNYQIQMSPFSACISLKRSLIKDKSGTPYLPPETSPAQHVSKPNLEAAVATLTAKNLALESSLKDLKDDYNRAVVNCKESHQKMNLIKEEKSAIKNEEAENKLLIDNLKYELDKMITDNMKLEEKVKIQEGELCELEKKMKVKNEIASTLNKQLSDVRKKTEKENALIKKMHTAELKSWRKKLGEERKQKIKLQEQLDRHSNSSPVLPSLSAFSPAMSNPECRSVSCSRSPVTILSQASEASCSSSAIAPLSLLITSSHLETHVPSPELRTPQESNEMVDKLGVDSANNIVLENPGLKCQGFPNIDKIKPVKNKADFERLVEIVRNTKLPYEIADEPLDEDDDYSNLDYENFPDGYWSIDVEEETT